MGRRADGSRVSGGRRFARTPYDTYRRWNEQLNQYFLSENNAGRPLYLDPDDGLFAHLENRFRLEPGTGRDQFLAMIRAILGDPDTRETLFERVEVDLSRWEKDAGDRRGATELQEMAFPPPVTSLLAMTVLAAQEMDESSSSGKYISSTNYYEHLRKVLALGEEHKEKLRRDFVVTEKFWESFSWWLDEMDGRFGLPSARATSSQRYVGLPVSQALVRAADRRALRRMFHQYGLAPGSALSPGEIREVISEWINSIGTSASRELATKWGSPEAQQRIIDVALSELEGWDGTVEATEREAIGVPRGLHRERVMLGVLVRGRSGGEEIADLGFVMRRGNEDEAWFLEHTEGAEQVHPRPVSAANSFVAGYELGVPGGEILSKEVALRSDSGRELRRTPRRIVVLVEDEAAGAFVEVRRAVSGARHRILVSPETPDDVIDELRTLLDLTGFAGRKDVEVHGIPEDWLVIADYVPGRIPANFDVGQELSTLVASVSTQFHVRGGIRLPGRVKRWHSDAVPQIIVTIGAEGGTYDLVLETLGPEGKRHTLRRGLTAPEVVELPDEVGDGDHRISLVQARKSVPVQTETLRLRSGRTVNLEGWHNRSHLAHGDGPLDAIRAGSRPYPVAVEGGVVTEPAVLPQAGSPPGAVDWAARHVRRRTAQSSLVLPRPSTTSCLVSGRHRFHFPTFKDDKKKPAWQTGVCEVCGAVRRTPTSHWMALKPEEREAWLRRKGRPVPAYAKVAEPTAEESAQLPDLTEFDIPPSVVLDAIAHVHSGDAAMLLALTAQVPELTEDHTQYLRDLSALGTVEASRDSFFRRDRWEAMPAAIVSLADGRAGLVGAWDLESLDGVEAVAEDLGATVRPGHDGLEITSIEGATPADIFEYEDVDGVSDAGTAYRNLAAALPPLSEVETALPRRDVAMVTGPWQMFSPGELTWIDVAGWDAPGLYRRHRGYRREYWFRSAVDLENGTGAPVDVDLGKHLVALGAGSPLLGYDESRRTLSVPLGARLPELYERSAVLCSGRVPTKRLDGFCLEYSDVPPEIAATLHLRMSS